MSESLVGLIVPATRQKATGTAVEFARCGVNAFGSTDAAMSMVVSFNFRPLRFSHGIGGPDTAPVGVKLPAMTAVNRPRATTGTIVFRRVFMVAPDERELITPGYGS